MTRLEEWCRSKDQLNNNPLHTSKSLETKLRGLVITKLMSDGRRLYEQLYGYTKVLSWVYRLCVRTSNACLAPSQFSALPRIRITSVLFTGFSLSPEPFSRVTSPFVRVSSLCAATTATNNTHCNQQHTLQPTTHTATNNTHCNQQHTLQL